jgi:hypothetical protein
MTITPLQRRLLALLMIEPGARAGRLQVLVTEAGWHPRPTTNGIARSLTSLVLSRLVRRVRIPDVRPATWRYSLTDRGQLEVIHPTTQRKAA